MIRRTAVLASLLAAIGVAPAAEAATFTVNDAGDGTDLVVDGACASAPGRCTLRAALTEANSTLASDTIGFAPGLAPIAPATPLPAITRPVAIEGGGTTRIEGERIAMGPLLRFSAGAATSALRRLELRGAGGTVAPLLRIEASQVQVREVVVQGSAGNGVEVGGTPPAQGVTISRSPVFGFPAASRAIALDADANGALPAPGIRIGPRRGDGTLPVVGAAAADGVVELFRGDPRSEPQTFLDELAVAAGEFTFNPPSEFSPDTRISATLSSGSGTSEFSAVAAVPSDIVSPRSLGAVARSTNEVRLAMSEPIAPASVTRDDIVLEMGGLPRPVSAVGVEGSQLIVSSAGWQPGEAGFVRLAAPGSVTDAVGNANLATDRLRVLAAPGDFIAPVASSVSASPRRICLTLSRSCRRTGLQVKFIASEPGRARLIIFRGNRRIGTDVAAVREAGPNLVRFTGRLGGRKLRAGNYRLLLVLEDVVGNESSLPPLKLFSVRRSRR